MALAFIHNKRPGIAVVKKSHTHSYTSAVTPPTCTEQGYTTYICSCGHSHKDNYIDPLGHYFSDEWTMNESEHWYACERCGARDFVGKHIPDRGAATNTDPIKCTVCGYIIAPALCSHFWGEWVHKKQETCEEAGEWERTCILCGAVEKKEIPALGHQLNSTITKFATCSTKGERYSWCGRCDYNNTEDIPATGAHTASPIGAVAATCTSEGSTAGSKCAVCETFLVEPTILPLVPHTLSDWQRSSDYHWKDCTYCGEQYLEYGMCDKNGLGKIVSEANCTGNEWRYKACSVCGRQHTSTIEIPDTAKGHSPSTTIKYYSPTQHRLQTICLKCFGILEDQIQPHIWMETAEGKRCKICGYAVQEDNDNENNGEIPLG